MVVPFQQQVQNNRNSVLFLYSIAVQRFTIWKFCKFTLDLGFIMAVYEKLKKKQECIPVGCVPSAAVAVSGWGECLPRGGGCLPREVSA